MSKYSELLNKCPISILSHFIKDSDSNTFTVIFPSLPGCITQGDDFEEAKRMAKEAAALWLFTSYLDESDITFYTSSEASNLKVSEEYKSGLKVEILINQEDFSEMIQNEK